MKNATYEEMRTALKELCKNEGLTYLERAFEDKSTIYERNGRTIIFNTNTFLKR